MKYQIAVSTKHGCRVMQNNKGIPFVFDAESAERWIKFIEFAGGEAQAKLVHIDPAKDDLIEPSGRTWTDVTVPNSVVKYNLIGA